MKPPPVVASSLTIDRARFGDREAMTTLWRTYQPQILRFLRATRAPSADDVASQVWIDVGRSIGRFEGDGTDFQRWIFTIANRRNIDELRRLGRRREISDTESIGRVEAIVDDSIETAGSLERALVMVRQLPVDMAEVVMLRIVFDMAVEDVAAVTGHSPGNVRVLAHRGLGRLRVLVTADDTESVGAAAR